MPTGFGRLIAGVGQSEAADRKAAALGLREVDRGATVVFVKAPLFVVPVADLDHGEQQRIWPIPLDYLNLALKDTEAIPRGAPGELRVTLSKSGREVVVRGTLQADLIMPCARTLDPVDVRVSSPVFLLLSRQCPSPTGTARVKPGKRKGGWTEDPTLSPENAAQDLYDGEKVVLDPYVREFLLLELPLAPLRSDLHPEKHSTIESPPQASASAASSGVDPRLAPLAAIANRMRQKKE